MRGVTFDLDGTLANTLPVCYAAFRRVFLEHTGREYSDAEIHGMFGPCEKGVFQAVLSDWRPAFAAFLKEYESAHDMCPAAFPGIAPLLDHLRAAGVRLAVVTGKGTESAQISLRRLGLIDRFECIEAGSPHGGAKSESIARILKLWEAAPGELAHVGDAPNDIRAARESGVAALAAAWAPTARREALAAEWPDAIFDSVTEFEDWLSARAGNAAS